MLLREYPLETILATAEEIVATKPDFVYKAPGLLCVYTDSDGTPSCLVGQIMHKLGCDDTPGWNDEGNTTSVGEFVQAAPSTDFLIDLQAWQDTGKTWGEALELAEMGVHYDAPI